MNVAILGYGVVGSGVAELLNQNKISIGKKANEGIDLIRILEIKDMEGNPFAGLVTKDPDDIFMDPAIDIVIETIGGLKAAYDYTKRAFCSGKHVVTSNKELVAKKGPELLSMAKENRVNYLFEASVGGGIPIIRPLEQCLAANEITMVAGILNSTTNYILTKMREEKTDFKEALAQAQKNGYAEFDSSSDIKGYDTRRKIAILSSIAYGRFVDSDDIPTTGIDTIDIDDIEYGRILNAKIKLVGMSRLIDGKVCAEVEPLMINMGEYLSSVDDVFNAILVRGDAIGEAMFYGRGAGKLPTASAVIADVIYITRNKKSVGRYDWSEKLEIVHNNADRRYFARINGHDHATAERITGGSIVSGVKDEEFGLVTGEIGKECIEELKTKADVIKVIKYL